MLDDDYQFHKDLVDFQDNEIISKHYSLNAARLRLFRINMGQPLLRLEVGGAGASGDSRCLQEARCQTAVDLLTRHIEISREHALGIRPMERIIDNKMVTTTPSPPRERGAGRKKSKAGS